MSAEHVGWAFRQKGLSPTRKLVLVALADRCNKDTLRCDPSIRKIADDTGLGKTAEAGIILRWLAQRHQAGRVLIVTRAAPEPRRCAIVDIGRDIDLKRVQRHRENGSATSNEFRFPDVTVSPPPRHSVTPPSDSVTPPEPELRTRTKN